MFDPTAFDNLRVVLEGAVYDADLSGEIEVINRKDLFDLATYQRSYSIQFQLKEQSSNAVEMKLVAGVEQVIVERRPTSIQAIPGASIQIVYESKNDLSSFHDMLQQVWGERTIEQVQIISTLNQTIYKTYISFARNIDEEMVEDVLAMVSTSIKSLQILKRNT